MGADCMQIFISPPQSWRSPQFGDAEVAAFKARRRTILDEVGAAAAREARGEDGLFGPVFLHTIYLINLVSATPSLQERSVRSLASYLDWAHRLGVEGVITHLGSARDVGAEEAARMLPEVLARVLASAAGEVPLLLETTAGPGAVLGSRFEELAAAMSALGWPARLRVCLDTAHVFASGLYDGTPAGLERMLADFDATIGLPRLMAIHLNDSKTAFGSRADRHANIGEGLLGVTGLRPFLQHPALRHLPFLLEVPGRDREGPRSVDIATAKALAGNAS